MWGGANPASAPAREVFLHPLQIYVVAPFVVIALEIKLRLGGVLAQAVGFQMQLILEQERVHGPEFMLRARRFSHLGREFGMRVHFALRKVSVYKAQLIAEVLEHYFHRRIGLRARRAFEVAILDHCDPGRMRTREMVALVYRDRQHDRLGWLIHRCLLEPMGACHDNL